MSQKVAIRRVRVHGSVYLGVVDDPVTGQAADEWSADPAVVMSWLCSGFQARFNQHRSTRCKYVHQDGERVLNAAGKPVLVPIGSSVTDISDKNARLLYPHLAALPAMVIQAAEKVERTDWFAATKRRATNVAAGRRAGAMPWFRSRKCGVERFVCWFNGGASAVFARTGRRSGVVTLTGANPAAKRGPAQRCWFKVVLHVRLSQPIRDYTSVRVNWTRRELVFVNASLPVTRRGHTGEARGFDRGVTHSLADSTGRFYDAPNVTALVKSRVFHQRKMAKSRLIAARQHRQFWESTRYQAHKTAAGAAQAKAARIMSDWRQQTSTAIVRDCDLAVFEDLKLANMTRKATGPGAAQKRGLNRVLLFTGLGELAALVRQKMLRAEGIYLAVNPAYTSQRCHQCGHTAKENRESQAVFRCQQCAHTANADTNAAKNILDDGCVLWARESEQSAGGNTGGPAGSKSETDPRIRGFDTSVSTASAMNCEPPSFAHAGI